MFPITREEVDRIIDESTVQAMRMYGMDGLGKYLVKKHAARHGRGPGVAPAVAVPYQYPPTAVLLDKSQFVKPLPPKKPATIFVSKAEKDQIIRDATAKAMKMYGLSGEDLQTVMRQYGLAGDEGLGQFDFSALISSAISAGSQIATARITQSAATSQARSAARVAQSQAVSAQAQQAAQEAALQREQVAAGGGGISTTTLLVGGGLLALVGVYFLAKR